MEKWKGGKLFRVHMPLHFLFLYSKMLGQGRQISTPFSVFFFAARKRQQWGTVHVNSLNRCQLPHIAANLVHQSTRDRDTHKETKMIFLA